MYNIEPKEGILLVRKHKNTQLKADIAVEETDNDKSLITGSILVVGSNCKYEVGKTVIFGKYAIFELKMGGEKYYFLDQDDVVGVTDYTE